VGAVLAQSESPEQDEHEKAVAQRLGRTRQRQQHEKGDDRNGGHQQPFFPLRHVAEGESPHEAADHQPAPVEGEVTARRLVRQPAHPGRAEEIDEGAADGNLSPDVHKNGDHAQHCMRVFESARAVRHLPGIAEIGQMNEPEDEGQQEKDPGEEEIGGFDGIGPMGVRLIEKFEDQIAADDRTDGGAQGVEGLAEIEAAGGSALGPQDCDVRIGRDLEHGKSQSDDEKRDQEESIGDHHCGGIKEGASDSRGDQADDHSILVADAVDRIAGDGRKEVIDQGTDSVGSEKGELHQHRLKIVEGKGLLEAGNEKIIPDGHESPHKKEHRHDRERSTVPLFIFSDLRLGRLHAAAAGHTILLAFKFDSRMSLPSASPGALSSRTEVRTDRVPVPGPLLADAPLPA